MDYTLTEEAVEEGEVDAVREELDTLAQQAGAAGVQRVPLAARRLVRLAAVAGLLRVPACTTRSRPGAELLQAAERGSSCWEHARELCTLVAAPGLVHQGLLAPPARPPRLARSVSQEGLADHWRAGTKAAARAFRAGYLELWAKLMREAYAADQGLFDQYLLDRLSSLLIALNTWVAHG